MRPVVIIGAGMIPFERNDDDSLVDMLAEAGLRAMDDAQLGDRSVDSVYVGNMASGLFNHQVSVASALVDRLALLPAAADRIENGPASGGSAIKNGFLAALRSSSQPATFLTAANSNCPACTGTTERFSARHIS